MSVPVRGLYDELFSSKQMGEIFCDRADVQGMLDFEAALARAESDAGVIPAEAATPIAAQCRAKRFDLERIAQDVAVAGNGAIPVIAALVDLVARKDPAAARFVHFGATSQDAIDTGRVLQLRGALHWFDTELGQLSETLAELVRRHRRTVMLGRTWLQAALPVTLGLKVAGWLSSIVRSRVRLRELRPRALVIQFGGATGTLASLGHRGLDVATRLARGLDLSVPDVPWHSARDRSVEIGAALGVVAGSLGKMARDLSLLSQQEVSEVREPHARGRGGSSSMPHKQNPVGCAVILAVAARVPGLVSTLLSAMPQEHERGLGGWQAEWDTLPEICLLTSGALMHAREVTGGLKVSAERMRANLNATGGVIVGEALALALTRHMDRSQAYALVERACRDATESGASLREVVETSREVTNRFSSAEIDELCDPAEYLGSAEDFAERALAEHARIARESEA